MKDFPWRAGMKRLCPSFRFDRVLEVVVTSDGVTWLCMATDVKGMIERDDPPEGSPWGWVKGSETDPDPNDGATKGALLDVVRELWNAPLAQVTPWLRWDPVRRVNVVDGWRVCLNDATDRRCPPNERAESEFAALLAAYQESP